MIALAQTHADWTVGFADETWWSRLARPALHTWREAAPLRLVEQTVGRADPDPKALACYGLLLRPGPAAPEELWLRSDQEPVAQSHRTQVGPRQTAHRRTGTPADRP